MKNKIEDNTEAEFAQNDCRPTKTYFSERKQQMIKVTDVAYARFAAPELDLMEAFLLDYGLTCQHRDDDTLYMRGTGPDHHIHITHLADEPGFIGMAFNAASMADLEKFSQVDGASAVEEMDEPGGGYRVRITDPNGFQVETIFGQATVAPLPVNELIGPDHGPGHPRDRDIQRAQKIPCPVMRLGHVVLNVPDCNVMDAFYRSHFGFLQSDICYVPGSDDDLAVAFQRCDKGKAYVDQHTLLFTKSKVLGLGHIAFEVEDINALFVGHELLKSKGYEHSWGIGRHTPAANIFDYWFDNYGNRVEHFYGGDLLNVDDETRTHQLDGILESQWGAQLSDRRASLKTDYDPLTA